MARGYRQSRVRKTQHGGPPKRAVPSVSLKRRAGSEAVDEREEGAEEAATEEATLVPRKQSSMTKDTLQRIRGDQRFARVDEDEADALRKQFESTLVILDEETGEPREYDTKKPADLEYLAREKNMNVLARADGVHGLPDDMRTGMVSMQKDELPEDFNSTGVLPLSGFQVKYYMRDEANTFADILMFAPIMPIPVFTPKLLNALMLGTPTFPTQDSFQLLKTYMAVLQLLRGSVTTRSRARDAVEWLCNRTEEHSITREDVARFTDNATFRCSIDDPTAADVLRMSVVQKFDAGELDDVDGIREFLPYIATVARYDGAGWAPAGRVFADDVMEEHAEQGIALCAEVGAIVERALATDPIDYTAVLGVVQHYTLRFLRLYETSIMRMLEEASKIGATVPRMYFGDLASPIDRVPAPEEVHISVRDSVRKAREFLTQVRNETLDLGVAVAHNPAREPETAPTDVEHNDCVPSIEELSAFISFVNYHADDEATFANSVARMQAAVHVVEPKELVEGLSVPEEHTPTVLDAGAYVEPESVHGYVA